MMARACLLPCLLACAAIAAGASIRGVDPWLARQYAPVDGQFTCLDGKKVLPFSQVNDDYCDCFDGSDEPGTSACSNGHFYCINRGAEPLTLNSSFVDDGVCDCCDGSDEQPGHCTNRCKEVGEALLAGLRQQVAATEAGVAAKKRYQKEAAAAKAAWQKRKAEVDSEVDEHKPKTEALAAEKTRLEEEEAKLRERKQKAEERRQAASPPPPAEAEREAADGADGQAGAQEGEHAAEQAAEEKVGEGLDAGEGDAAHAAGDGEAADGRAADSEAQAGDSEEGGGEAAAAAAAARAREEEERRAQEVMAQWVPGAKDAGAAAVDEADTADAGQHYDEEAVALSASEEELEQEEPEEQFFPEHGGDDYDAGAEHDGGGGDGDPGADGAASPAPAPAPEQAAGLTARLLAGAQALMNRLLQRPASADETDAELAALERQLAAVGKRLADARARHTESSSRQRQLESEASELAAKLEREYGEGDAFVALADRCFEAHVDKYTYEVCPFKSASQKEGGSSTSLGHWEGFREDFTVMAFTNGAHCWQGPSRTMTVSLVCGAAEQLQHVAEPSRCEYTAELATPAACNVHELQGLKVQLQAKQETMAGPPARDEL